MKKIILVIFILCFILTLSGCMKMSTNNERRVSEVTLSEKQQKVADGIWNAKGLWRGCSDLEIYKHNGKYYLAANKLIGEQRVEDLFGGQSTVGTYKRYAYTITADGEILDDLSLADAGVTSVGQRLAVVHFSEEDSESIKLALVRQLVSEVNF